MLKIWILILVYVLGMSAHASILNSGAISVQSEIMYYEFEVQAKCARPQHKDDAHRVHFAPQSYNEIMPYMDKGYTLVLLDRMCGYQGKGARLPEDQYDKVRILIYNTFEASKAIDVNVKALLQTYGIIEL